MTPSFQVKSLGSGQYTIDENGKTVAIVTSQGLIDWLIYEPDRPGELITKLYKETHLSYTMGFKLEMSYKTPSTKLKRLTYTVSKGGEEVRLHANCESDDGIFTSTTDARLFLAEDGRYRWNMVTSLRNRGDEPADLKNIEYNNVYPSKAGRCMLYAPSKEYRSTLMTDKDGVVWEFPHQHMLHYTVKINTLNFAAGSIGCFAGEPGGNPSVTVTECTHEPDWGICDMYYDLHCQGRLSEPLSPGGEIRYAYTVRYMSPSESIDLDRRATRIPITADDLATHDYPRIDLGMNRFTHRCELDRMDDCSGFRPRPPQRVWDRQVGHVARGSLRITNDSDTVTDWGAEPPTMIPPGTTLGINGKIKTRDVDGKGAYIKVRYHTFEWHPRPHVEWIKDLESVPITGTTEDWVLVTVPSLRVEETELDYLVSIHVMLEGEGVAWFTDVDIDLVKSFSIDPVLDLKKPLVPTLV